MFWPNCLQFISPLVFNFYTPMMIWIKLPWSNHPWLFKIKGKSNLVQIALCPFHLWYFIYHTAEIFSFSKRTERYFLYRPFFEVQVNRWGISFASPLPLVVWSATNGGLQQGLYEYLRIWYVFTLNGFTISQNTNYNVSCFRLKKQTTRIPNKALPQELR